jgi:hypothetical protein
VRQVAHIFVPGNGETFVDLVLHVLPKLVVFWLAPTAIRDRCRQAVPTPKAAQQQVRHSDGDNSFFVSVTWTLTGGVARLVLVQGVPTYQISMLCWGLLRLASCWAVLTPA